MRENKIYVLGSINIDLVADLITMPKEGETIYGKTFTKNLGGKGKNQALSCARLGLDTYMIATVGTSTYGIDIKKILKDNKIKTDYLNYDCKKETGLTIILTEDSENRIIYFPGSNHSTLNNNTDYLRSSNNGDIIISQLELPYECVEKHFKLAKQKGLKTILNLAPAMNNIDSLLPFVDYLILNQTECQTLTEIYPSNHQMCKLAYDKVQNLGVKNLIITMGEKGSVWINEKGCTYYKSYDIKPIDTTGAGDAFIGMFSYCILNGFSKEKTLKYSNGAGAKACLVKGVENSINSIKEIENFIKQTKIK